LFAGYATASREAGGMTDVWNENTGRYTIIDDGGTP